VTVSRSVHRRFGARGRVAGTVALTLLGLTSVAGCGGGIAPGRAATVDGQSISQDSVDSVVSAACAYTSASGGGSTPTSLANLRASITQAEIQYLLTDRLTDDMGLSVSQASIATIQNQTSIPKSLSADDVASLTSFFYAYAKSTSELQLLGAHLTDPSVTASAQVKGDKSSVAVKYLIGYAEKQDISVNPAYGQWTGSQVLGGSGSLSDAVSSNAKDSAKAASDAQADASGLLSTQVC
jgi:hypothetical protein